jgi:hypothetical protein
MYFMGEYKAEAPIFGLYSSSEYERPRLGRRFRIDPSLLPRSQQRAITLKSIWNKKEGAICLIPMLLSPENMGFGESRVVL